MTTAPGSRTIPHDEENRPVSVVMGGTKTCYVYGADGARLKKIAGLATTQSCDNPSGSNITTRLYFGPVEIENLTPGGTSDRITVYPHPNVKLTSGRALSHAEFLHRDHLASVRAITPGVYPVPPTELRSEATVYKPYGERVPTVTALQAESKGWIGERFDPETGLQYLNARYYDPELGMFLQPDWWEVTKPGVGTNRYAYSFGDPVNKMDPGGNNAVAVARGIIGFFGAIFGGEVASDSRDGRFDGNGPLGTAMKETGRQLSSALSGDQQAGSEEDDLDKKRESILERSGSRTLANNMIKATGLPREKNVGAHHIVAENAKKAAPAQAVLVAVGIGINDMENGVFVETPIHNKMHTDAYYGRVNAGITAAYSNGGSRGGARTSVVHELNQIRAEIQAGLW